MSLDGCMESWGIGMATIMMIGIPLFGLFALLDNLEYVPMVLFILVVPVLVGTLTMKYYNRKKVKKK